MLGFERKRTNPHEKYDHLTSDAERATNVAMATGSRGRDAEQLV
jgi:hypothetical protein